MSLASLFSFGLVSVLAGPPVLDPTPIQAEERVVFTLEISGAGESALAEKAFTWRAPRSCTAWIWCRSSDIDPSLIVEINGRAALTDDNGGDGTTALVQCELALNEPVLIRARGRAGRCEIQITSTYESDAARSLHEQLKDELSSGVRGQAVADTEARAVQLAQSVDEILDTDQEGRSLLLAESLWTLAGTAYENGEMESASRAYSHIAKQRERTLSPDHRDVHRARLQLAMVMQELGDVEGSVEIKRESLAALTAVLPPESRELVIARANLASGLAVLGRHDEAIREFRALLTSAWVNTPAGRHLRATLRTNLAEMLLRSGDLAGARDEHESSLRAAELELGPESIEVAGARLNFAILCSRIGECDRARSLIDAAISSLEARLAEDSVQLLKSQMRAAEVFRQCGEYSAARSLAERLLPRVEHALGSDSLEAMQLADLLGSTLAAQGEFLESRDLMEAQLVRRVQRLPAGSLDLEALRINLSNVLGQLGDGQGARSMLELAVAGLSGVVPPGHPTLAMAMSNLAEERRRAGDHAGCLELQQQVFSSLNDASDPGGALRARIQVNMASTLIEMGRSDEAEDLLSEALVCLLQDPAPNAYFIHVIRSDLAFVRTEAGDLEGALWHLEQDLNAPNSEGLDVIDTLHTRSQFADILARRGEVARLPEILRSILADIENQVALHWNHLSVREADNLSRELRTSLQAVVSITRSKPLPELDLAILRVDQLLRQLPLARAATLRRALTADVTSQAAERLADLGSRITQLARAADSSEELAASVGERARLEREILLAFAPTTSDSYAHFDLDCVRTRLGTQSACVSFVTTRDRVDANESARLGREFQLMAFVLRAEGPPVRIHLGPWGRIEKAIEAWRATIVGGASSRGLAGATADPGLSPRSAGILVRELVLDPLATALEGVGQLHMTLDGMLAFVPLDGLPDGPGDGVGVVGDRFAIEVHETLVELCEPTQEPDEEGLLVAVGDVDYGAAEFDPESGPAIWSSRTSARPAFPALPATRIEIERLAELWPGPPEGQLLLTGARASEPMLRAAAVRARHLHIATHGWTAPAALMLAADVARIRDGITPLEERDRERLALSPLSFSGLALAGIAADSDSLGRRVGSLDGEELASWDLSRCSLAVFSACESALGTHRTGRAADGLQRAARIAGARQVLCSLWPVPDAATSELMSEFYAGLWKQGLAPARALWRAKCILRSRVDENGSAVHDLDAWAAWTLSGPAP